MLLEWCEIGHVLHRGQMRYRRQRTVIDPVARVISMVQEAWVEGKITGMLLIDVKRVFDNVS